MKAYFESRCCDMLDADWPVIIGGNSYSSAEVLKTVAPHDFDALFTEWIETTKSDARQRTSELLHENGCLNRFNRLAERYHDGLVIPFVGAGMSRPSGFPLWAQFLHEVSHEDRELTPRVVSAMDSGEFEIAAQIIVDHIGENILAENIENCFERRRFEIRGPIGLLPFLFSGGCITTNFDHVLAEVFKRFGSRFEEEYFGEAIQRAPRESANSRHVLFKLHGHASSSHGRILTATEYERSYGQQSSLSQLLRFLLSNRSILFLGCSLSIDRTVRALEEIKGEASIQLPRHYAFLSDPGLDGRIRRRRELEAAEIHPIWYGSGTDAVDHDSSLEDLLISLSFGPLET